jgi:hypothetical protein
MLMLNALTLEVPFEDEVTLVEVIGIKSKSMG